MRAWLVGQAVALRELSWKLAQNPNPDERDPRAMAGAGLAAEKVPQTSFSSDNDFAATQRAADELARRAATRISPVASPRALLRKLSEADADFTAQSSLPNDLSYRRAQRLLLALQTLAPTNETDVQLEALRNDLRSPTDFAPAQFAAHLALLRQTLP